MSDEPEVDGQGLPRVRTLLRAGLASGALGLVVLGVAWIATSRFELDDEQLSLLEGTRWVYLVPSIALLMSGLVCVGMRWRALIPDSRRVGRVGISGIVCSGFLLNYALPGPAGELISAALVDRVYGVRTSVALAASLHSRVVGLATAGGIALIAWATGALPVPEGYEGMIGAATLVLGVGVVGLGVLSAWPGIIVTIASWTLGPLERLPGALGRGVAGLHRAVRAVAEALASVGHLGVRSYAVALGWSTLGYLMVAGGMWAACIALGVTASPAGLLFSHAAASAGMVVLFAFPGAQLGWDALLCAFLVAGAGISLTAALAVATVIRVQFLVAMLVGAAALWVLLPRKAAEPSG